jgi:hypothetical protein
VSKKGGWVYTVDLSGLISVDVMDSLPYDVPHPEYLLQFEQAIPGGVPLQNVVGATRVHPGGALGDYVPNPHYRP